MFSWCCDAFVAWSVSSLSQMQDVVFGQLWLLVGHTLVMACTGLECLLLNCQCWFDVWSESMLWFWFASCCITAWMMFLWLKLMFSCAILFMIAGFVTRHNRVVYFCCNGNENGWVCLEISCCNSVVQADASWRRMLASLSVHCVYGRVMILTECWWGW